MVCHGYGSRLLCFAMCVFFLFFLNLLFIFIGLSTRADSYVCLCTLAQAEPVFKSTVNALFYLNGC